VAPFWASSYSALDATCYRLAQAEALGLLETAPETQLASRFLLERQREDGSWDETPPQGVTAPPWIQPGTPETVCYLTANCGFWLTQFTNTQNAAERAAHFLQEIRYWPPAWDPGARPLARGCRGDECRRHPQRLRPPPDKTSQVRGATPRR